MSVYCSITQRVDNIDIFITVFGWLNDSFTAVERMSPHNLKVGYSKGGEQAQVNISFSIISQVQTASE